jgi:murein DD-endopeptidase MepM/ murein hydrolase activator NlpD
MKAIFLAQFLIPIVLIGWLFLRPSDNWMGFFSQLFAAASVLAAAALIGIWVFPPWWTPWVFAVLLLMATVAAIARAKPLKLLPQTGFSRIATTLALLVGSLGAWAAVQALAGHRPPPIAAVSLRFPLAAGRYLVVNGGNSVLLNAHADALDQSVVAHRAFWGTSYGIDIVETDGWGLRARGISPVDPAAYRIFGTRVVAPCAGEIISVVDDKNDMPVPQRDPTGIPGNHVILRCQEADILLAHFRKGSLQVRAGARLSDGDVIAEAGNSGASDEPHLHIHAQLPGAEDAPFSGRPIPIVFGGRYLVRNDRITAE